MHKRPFGRDAKLCARNKRCAVKVLRRLSVRSTLLLKNNGGLNYECFGNNKSNERIQGL